MIHVVSGDGAALVVKELGLGGEVLVFREALATGPISLEPFGRDACVERARFLGTGAEGLAEQIEALASAASSAGEIALWFGRDLFCQANFAAIATVLETGTKARLTAVLPTNAEPCCLSGAASEFRAWFDERAELSAGAVAQLANTWRQFSSTEPPAIPEGGPPTDRSERAAHAALFAHLRRFPDRDGLGADERTLIELARSPSSFGALFRAFGRRHPELGWGDVQVALLLDGLSSLPDPALSRDGDRIHATVRGLHAIDGAWDLRADGNDVARTIGGAKLGLGCPDWRWTEAGVQRSV